ncbi:MAG: hypothetical protein ACYDAR_08430 [Thermomicrobiales bacterium]
MHTVPKHPQAVLYPNELVTLALLFALKGVGERAFSRWLVRDLAPLFTAHHAWVGYFLAAPTVLGVAETDGIELSHPWREGRSPQQIGGKGMRNHRWIVGGNLALVLLDKDAEWIVPKGIGNVPVRVFALGGYQPSRADKVVSIHALRPFQ